MIHKVWFIYFFCFCRKLSILLSNVNRVPHAKINLHQWYFLCVFTSFQPCVKFLAVSANWANIPCQDHCKFPEAHIISRSVGPLALNMAKTIHMHHFNVNSCGCAAAAKWRLLIRGLKRLQSDKIVYSTSDYWHKVSARKQRSTEIVSAMKTGRPLMLGFPKQREPANAYRRMKQCMPDHWAKNYWRVSPVAA